MVHFGTKKKNAVTLPHSSQRKHEFWGGNKGNVKIKEITIQKENFFRIFSQDIRSQIH